MIGIISCIFGIIVLIRGQFRLAGRTIPTPRARIIGLALIAPLVFELCYSMSLVSQAVTYTPDGSVTLSQEAMNAVLESVTPVQLIVLGFSIAFALYLIFSLPPDALGSGDTQARTGTSGFFTRPPDSIESAPPQNSSAPQDTSPSTPHPLEGEVPRGAFSQQQRPKPTTQRDHPLGGFTRVVNPAQAKQPKSIMNLDEAAAYLNITREGVLALIDASKLPAARNNGTYAIARIAIDDYLAEQNGSTT